MRKHRPTIRDHSAEANLFARRAFVGFVFVTLLIGVLLSNLYNIQVIEHQDYQTRSNDNRIKVIPIAPNRGLIYDRNGVLLAENKPVYNLENKEKRKRTNTTNTAKRNESKNNELSKHKF